MILGLLTALNIYGRNMGKKGVQFVYETDNVMGPLLGLPHYSKIASLMCAAGTIGCLMSWGKNASI